MKNIISTLLLILILISSLVIDTAYADTGFDSTKVNLNYFEFEEVNGGLSIGIKSNYKSYTGELHIPKSFEGEDIIAISYAGFSNQKAEKIYFEDSSKITEIGESAFTWTKADNSISFMNIEVVPGEAFDNSKFTSINLDGEKITYIGDYAFQSTKATNEMSFPNITELGSSAFANSRATKLTFGNKLKIINEEAFNNAYARNDIQLDGVITVRDNAFSSSNFSSIKLDNALSIGPGAFSNSSATNSISLLKISTVPQSAFDDSEFSEILLDSNKITKIGIESFRNSKATNIMNLFNITEVPKDAFYGSTFSEINLSSEKLTSIGINAFREASSQNILNLASVSNIGDNAFTHSRFSNILLDSSKITYLGDSPFYESTFIKNNKLVISTEQLTVKSYAYKNGSDNKTVATLSDTKYSLNQTGLYTQENAVLIPGNYSISQITPEILTTGLPADNKPTLTAGVDFWYNQDYTYVSLPFHDEPNKVGSVASIASVIGINPSKLSGLPEPPEPPFIIEDKTNNIELGLSLKSGTLVISRISLTPLAFNIELTGKLKYETKDFGDTIEVLDSRGSQEGWNLVASADTLKTDGGSDLGIGSLSLIGLDIKDDTDSDAPLTVNSDTLKEIVLDSGSVKVSSGNTGGTFSHKFKSLKIKIDPAKVKLSKDSDGTSGVYKTTITWLLSTGP